ncbi:MAG: hypothetical protein IPI90_15695 [Saprospiraceae bacterium]|nr:hypothetical protein [Candidatus Vicinibacter affinis]
MFLLLIYLFIPIRLEADYSRSVVISGLARDARMKITDIGGRLVFETIANGGTAIWYGKIVWANLLVREPYLLFANSTPGF